MAAENNSDRLSFSQAVGEGHHERPVSASQPNSPVLLTGCAVNQSYAASCPQTLTLGATSVRILPTLHASRHTFTAGMASSVSTAVSLSSYAHHTAPVSPCDTQGNRAVFINPVQQQQNVVPRTVSTVRQAAQPTAVLDLGNNGIFSAVLGRLPNVGPMVVHSLNPGSVIQKNIVAMIDGRASAVPVLTLSYQGTMSVSPPRQATSQIPCRVSQASAVQHSFQPVVVSQIRSGKPRAPGSLTAKQRVEFSWPSVSAINTSPQQPPSLNPPVMRHMITVRTVANSSSHTQQNLSVSPAESSRFTLANAAETVPRIKIPHAVCSLPDALVSYRTTATAQVVPQSSATVATQAALQLQPNVSLPLQAKLIAALPSFVTNMPRNAPLGSGTNIASPASKLAPSESLTTIIPSQSLTIPFEIAQSDVNTKVLSDCLPMVHLPSTQSPLVAGTAAVTMAGISTSLHLATSLIHVPTCTSVICNTKNVTSPVFSSQQTIASYFPLPVHRFSVPSVRLHEGQVNSTAETKKRSVKRPPRQKMMRLSCPVSDRVMNVNQTNVPKQTFYGSVAIPIASSPVMIHSSSCTAAARGSKGTLMAGVKRKCTPGRKYTLLLESGCKYSCVYFDGLGFQAKKPVPQTGSCYCCLLMV